MRCSCHRVQEEVSGLEVCQQTLAHVRMYRMDILYANNHLSGRLTVLLLYDLTLIYC